MSLNSLTKGTKLCMCFSDLLFQIQCRSPESPQSLPACSLLPDLGTLHDVPHDNDCLLLASLTHFTNMVLADV